MAKLSRTARFQELRDQLDEETTVAQTSQNEQIKLTRSTRAQNNALHANEGQAAVAEPVSKPQSSTVMDELLGEVKQYNIDNGDRAAEDTQINILKTLDTPAEKNIRRNAHMETMEANEEAGGTTMNVMSQNIDVLFRPERKEASRNEVRTQAAPAQEIRPDRTQTKEAPVKEAAVIRDDIVLEDPTAEESEADRTRPVEISLTDLKADFKADHDQLEMFDLGADDFDRTIRQIQAAPAKFASRKEAKKARKKAKANEQKSIRQTEQMSEDLSLPTEKISLDEMDDYDDEPKQAPAKSSRAANIILGILIVLLIAAIAATLYLIYQAGIF